MWQLLSVHVSHHRRVWVADTIMATIIMAVTVMEVVEDMDMVITGNRNKENEIQTRLMPGFVF